MVRSKMKIITIAILALIPATLLMANTQTQMTALDKALEAATKNPEKQSDYYNLFLNSEIFVPTHDLPLKEGRNRVGAGETIRPIIMDNVRQRSSHPLAEPCLC